MSSALKARLAYEPLLTRDQFREGVFARDGHRCVICQQRAVDAHHILERRLFDDGGYYLGNGASLCARHHIEAEKTTLSVEDIRKAIGLEQWVFPGHLYPDERYDKWGNIILPDGRRTPGELFHDESVQKILREVLPLFTPYVKYPRTWHLPWSPGATSDDRVLPDTVHFQGREIVVTEKMDGENTTLYRDYYHARSVDAPSRPWQSYGRQLHARIAHEIPEGWRVCCENLFAVHSIAYPQLPGYLMVFSIWNEQNVCLSWAETVEWAALLGLPTVPVLYAGRWSELPVRECHDPCRMNATREGYVVRVADAFPYGAFRRSVAKYVRAGHVQTSHHWTRERIVRNGLASDVSS